MTGLAVFDMDSTLIQCEVIDELARMSGRFDEVAAITEQAMRGQIEFIESLKKRVELIKGISEEQIKEFQSNLPYTKGLAELINFLKERHYITAILSGGFQFFAEQIKNDFDFDYIRCNQLEMIDGKLSGRLIDPIIDQHAKAAALVELAEKNKIDLKNTIAVGDGMNDLAMLKKAGLGIGFCPKAELAKQISHVIHTADLTPVIGIVLDQQN